MSKNCAFPCIPCQSQNKRPQGSAFQPLVPEGPCNIFKKNPWSTYSPTDCHCEAPATCTGYVYTCQKAWKHFWSNLCCKSQSSWLEGVMSWQVRLGVSATILWKQVTEKCWGSSGEEPATGDCGMWLCDKRNNKILRSTNRKCVGLEIFLELLAPMCSQLSGPGSHSSRRKGEEPWCE